MADKTVMVELKNSTTGVDNQTLTIDHAERLLKMPNNGGWELADNSFKFDLKDGIKPKSNTGNPKEAGK